MTFATNPFRAGLVGLAIEVWLALFVTVTTSHNFLRERAEPLAPAARRMPPEAAAGAAPRLFSDPIQKGP